MARIEDRRTALLAGIPARYSGALHFAFVNLLGAGLVAASLAQVRELAPWQLACVPAFLLFDNLFEWWIHKGPLHRRAPLLGRLYERHTRSHHVVFTAERMAIGGARELKLVLFPAWVLPLLLVLVAPLTGALFLIEPNLAWLFLGSSFAYYLLYEWLHTLHHLPRRGWLARSRLAAALGEHHARHHEPARMTRGNFNVSFPLADWLLRSTLPAEERVTDAPDTSSLRSGT